MKVNQTLTLHLFGRPERVRILVVRRAGTVDVERLSDGRCFRVSGLASRCAISCTPSSWPR
jgi:hypothetical protein